MILADLIIRYLKYSEVNHSKNTQSIYKTVTRYMLEIFENIEVQEIKKTDLERYKEFRSTKVSNVSVNKEIRSIKAILNFAIEEEIIVNISFRKVKQLKVPNPKRRALNGEEVDILLEIIDNELIKNITIVGLTTGCRLNEILWLRWRNINLNSDIPILKIENSNDFKTKNYENREIPITDFLKETIIKIKNSNTQNFNDSGFVFSNNEGKPYNKSYISRKFKLYILKSGLNKDFHFHCLRHTAITDLANRNNNIKVIQEIAGHSNIGTTMGYIYCNPKEKFKALNTLTYFENKLAS